MITNNEFGYESKLCYPILRYYTRSYIVGLMTTKKNACHANLIFQICT